MRICLLPLLLACWWLAGGELPGAGHESPQAFHERLDAFPVVDEIDTARVPPVHESSAGASVVTNLLGRSARVLLPGGSAKCMAWVIGRNRGLQPGKPYMLSIEFPDDVSRTLFVANRGADMVRGFATGTATGDVRQQYTQPSLESLSYPQGFTWERYRTIFVLHHRFQGVKAQRDPKAGGRPFGPADGFHVVLFQSRQENDPRSAGAAIGKIRLHEIPDLAALTPDIRQVPDGLPRRHVFFREEMGDEPVSGRAPEDRACADPVEWYAAKARVARAVGFNTFGKDLLEFGHNQGWKSGDERWVANAQPPLTDLWSRLVPRISAEGMEILPYYEYKGSLGISSATPPSLGWQRRAEKLYHGHPNTNYTGVWWVEQHNADLTDPDCLADAKRVLDMTVLSLKDKAKFAGVWFRTRGNHLPVSFAAPALARFRAAFPNDPIAKSASRDAIIASYEGDRRLYERYVDWWLDARATFLSALQGYVATGLGRPNIPLLFTPWPGEPIPLLRDPASGTAGHPVQIVTDEPAWWEAFARTYPDSSWFRWAFVPRSFDSVVNESLYARSLAFRELISQPPSRSEEFHAAPGADPHRYTNQAGVMLTFPIGRLFTVARPELLENYRSRAGLTVVRHFPLNEDNPDDSSQKGPFGGEVGYACVDVDRAGPLALLQEARAVANGDPLNIGYLCGSIYSTGFPGYVRRFSQAWLSVPALPSNPLPEASPDPEVVVRRVRAGDHGDYFMAVNTSMRSKNQVELRFPVKGKMRDLAEDRDVPEGPFRVDFYAGELRSYHANKAN